MASECSPLAVDLTNCDREPIHVPGAVQPHGVLLVLEEPELLVLHASESTATHLGRRAQDVVGARLSELIDAVSVEHVRAALRRRRPADENPIPAAAGTRGFDGLVHRHDGLAILELEPREPPQPGAAGPALLSRALAELQEATSLADLFELVVQSVRSLTGFERVLLYRFEDVGHGAVVAESKKDSLDPYLGLHYPASDIPRQARELYLRNTLRIIPEASYVPSPIVPARRRDTGGPVDLSCSVLRSVSPIHLEYLANMGVRACMSISLVVGGRLWGLISCLHHGAPRFVGFEVRAACEAIGRLVSLLIPALGERDAAAALEGRLETGRVLAETMSHAPAEVDVLDALMTCPEALLALVRAEGAAVVRGGEVRACGRTPPEQLVAEIASWLDERGAEAPFATSSLCASLESARVAADVASGLLTILLPGTPRRRVLWFRPEIVQTVEWGGDPRKPVDSDARARIHPRRSFDKWKQEVHMQALAWTEADRRAADDLRRKAVEIDLGRQLDRANRAVRARDDVVAVVSHDLKNPLNVIKLQATLLRDFPCADDEAARRMRVPMERIDRSADRMMSLVSDLLDLARVESGRFVLERRPASVREVVDEAIAQMRSLAEAKGIALHVAQGGSCVADVDRERVFQVLSNIIGNAIKFTPAGGAVTVRTESHATEIRVTVADTGPGIPDEAMAHVFERYWRAPQAERSRGAGAGLGLYIAKGIVEAHGGRIWVARAPAGGAQFTFTFPLAGAAAGGATQS